MIMKHSQNIAKDDATTYFCPQYTSDTKYGGIFSPTPINSPTLWISTECPIVQFNFVINNPELVQIPQDKGSVHKSAPIYNAQVFHSPEQPSINQGSCDSHLHNFLHQLIEHRKTV